MFILYAFLYVKRKHSILAKCVPGMQEKKFWKFKLIDPWKQKEPPPFGTGGPEKA